MNIDCHIRYIKHLDIQLSKAKNGFKALIRLFNNNQLSVKAKIICYLLLIRPILTYAAPHLVEFMCPYDGEIEKI